MIRRYIMRKIKEEITETAVTVFNVLEILGIFLTLFAALSFQIVLHDLPCPLCILQRIGFFGVAYGLLLNLRYGLHSSHYSIALLSALFTNFVALWQIALHIVPGTGSYGLPFLGLHLYTWSYILSMLILISTSILLGFERQYKNAIIERMRSHWLTHLLFVITLILLLTNIISISISCGFSECPETHHTSSTITINH